MEIRGIRIRERLRLWLIFHRVMLYMHIQMKVMLLYLIDSELAVCITIEISKKVQKVTSFCTKQKVRGLSKSKCRYNGFAPCLLHRNN